MGADNGHIGSMKMYFQMLKNGDGIPVDLNEAEKYSQMIRMHLNLNKKKKFDVLFFLNDDERAYLYKMEAQQDHFESMVYYAYYQYYGLGVPVNKEVHFKRSLWKT